MPTLANEQIKQFTTEGFARIDGAFPRELADEGRAILWKDTGCVRKIGRRGLVRSYVSVNMLKSRSGKL